MAEAKETKFGIDIRYALIEFLVQRGFMQSRKQRSGMSLSTLAEIFDVSPTAIKAMILRIDAGRSEWAVMNEKEVVEFFNELAPSVFTTDNVYEAVFRTENLANNRRVA